MPTGSGSSILIPDDVLKIKPYVLAICLLLTFLSSQKKNWKDKTLATKSVALQTLAYCNILPLDPLAAAALKYRKLHVV